MELAPVCKVLHHRGRYDLVHLLSRASIQFVADWDRFVTTEIHAPLSEYDHLKALSQEDTQTIHSVVLEVWPEYAEDAPIEGMVYRLDRDSLTDIPNYKYDLGTIATAAAPYSPPSNWLDTEDFRLFISHIAIHKDVATRLKECLEPYAISGFVSHQDIDPTLEWQGEIERALSCMDAMVAIHTVGFAESSWTQQEIGFAIGRSVKVISLKFDEDPTGFIARNQALARERRRAEEIAEEIHRLLMDDDRTRERLETAMHARDQSTPGDFELPF